MSPFEELHLLLLLPLVSAVVLVLIPRRLRGCRKLENLGIGFAIVMSLCLVYITCGFSAGFTSLKFTIPWLQLDAFKVHFGYLLDPSAKTLLFVVCFIGLWVQVFSLGYMSKDPARKFYYSKLSLFLFAMLGLTLAADLFALFVFWELVGLGSYLLIGHYGDAKGAFASKKAFLMNRVGDIGLLLGILWAYQYYGTADILDIRNLIQSGEKSALTGIGLLLACGFLGKSAQFPLHSWLPDAMAGPTPISAFIHAATMVAAGIYLLIRVFFMLSPVSLNCILIIGALMSCLTALAALQQSDLKKSLAYSTLSHLGLMAAAIGLGLPGVAMLHLLTHAFFKATLFLSAGSVIHACRHEQNIFRLGGLWRTMPITALSFGLAALALAGLPFFSGYYSKHAITSAAHAIALLSSQSWLLLIYALLSLSALLAPLYIMRLFALVFLGSPRSTSAAQASSSPWTMQVPLMVLCVLAVGGGWFSMDQHAGQHATTTQQQTLGANPSAEPSEQASAKHPAAPKFALQMLPEPVTEFPLSGYHQDAEANLADYHGGGALAAHKLAAAHSSTAQKDSLISAFGLVLIPLTLLFYVRRRSSSLMDTVAWENAEDARTSADSSQSPPENLPKNPLESQGTPIAARIKFLAELLLIPLKLDPIYRWFTERVMGALSRTLHLLDGFYTAFLLPFPATCISSLSATIRPWYGKAFRSQSRWVVASIFFLLILCVLRS